MLTEIYGLAVDVDSRLAGLVPGLKLPARPADLEIHLGAPADQPAAIPAAFYQSADVGDDGEPEFRAYRDPLSGDLRMAYHDGVDFHINAQGTRVGIALREDLPLATLVPALMGPVMGVVLRLRGTVCLHASAVAVDGRAVALVGDSGAGKSTTAAAFAQRGHPVLTDDVLALVWRDGAFWVQPAYPRIRLWPRSAEGLFGAAHALPRMVEGWDKRVVDLEQPGMAFQREALPLQAMYFLGARGARPHTELTDMHPAQALMRLVSDSFATNFQDQARRASEFEQLGRLMASVRLRQVSAPDDLALIGGLCDAIVTDLRPPADGGAAH
jgi:hypothetical protein